MTVPAGVVFDLDGTLVCSAPLHRYCLRQAVIATGGPPPTAARMASAERPTDLGTLLALVGVRRLPAAVRAYRSAFAAGLATRPPAPMPAATAALRTLRRLAVPVGICTGRARPEAAQLLAAAGLDLDLTVTREDCRCPKPAPEGLLMAVRHLGLVPADAVFVGDRPSDATQGAAAGVETLILTPEAAQSATGLAGLVARIEGRSS